MKSVPSVSFYRQAMIALALYLFISHPLTAGDQTPPPEKPIAPAKAIPDAVPGMQGTKVKFDFNTLDMSAQTLLQIWPSGFAEESSSDPKGTTSKSG